MESVPYPLSSGAFLTQPLLQAFLLQDCWAGAATPAFSSRLVYLKFPEGLLLSHLRHSGRPPPLCYVSFCCCCCLLSLVFSLFSLHGHQSVQGAMLIWPSVVCGSTMCLLAHLVVCFFRASRSWCLVAQEPSWFLRLTWSGMLFAGWGCGGVGVLPLLGGFSCNVFLQRLSKILL
jgi:hypothetical protein